MSIYGDGSRRFDKKLKRYVWEGYYKTKLGERKRKKITARTKQELVDKVESWKNRLNSGVLNLKKQLTARELAEIWLSSIGSSIKPGTLSQYASSMTAHVLPTWGNRKVDSLTPIEIQLWLNDLSQHLAARTCNLIRGTFFTMCRWAVEQQLIKRNPLTGVRSIRQKPKPVHALTSEQLEKLINVAKSGAYYHFANNDGGEYMKHEVYVAVLLDSRTGLRRGELFGLKWSDIDFEKPMLRVSRSLDPQRRLDTTKTAGSTRNVLLDSSTAEVLAAWKAYQEQYMHDYAGIADNRLDLVFTTMTGTAVSVDNFRTRYWSALTKAADCPGLHFHDLRHTHATLLLEAGIPVKAVSERLGHSDPALTMRVYAAVLPTMQQQIIDVLERGGSSKNDK